MTKDESVYCYPADLSVILYNEQWRSRELCWLEKPSVVVFSDDSSVFSRQWCAECSLRVGLFMSVP